MSDTPNIPQQEARELATRCAQVLQHRFGARRVIPFGSVVGHGIWHPGSDIDLAVEGLAPEQFFRAWATLRKLLPAGLEVDLVDLEHAGEALQARILGEQTMSEDLILTLKALIEDELAALRHTVQAVQEGLSPVEEAPSQFVMNACASYLHQFYTGCERILERIAVTVDGRLPSGAFSHANLLAQMARELPGIRPAPCTMNAIPGLAEADPCRSARLVSVGGDGAVRIAVPGLISNSYFPAVAAVEPGFFNAEGLDVELELLFPVPRTMEALRDGSLDFVAGAAHATLSAFSNWQGARLLVALAQRMYWLLIRRDLPYYDPVISPDVVTGVNRFALDVGLLSGPVPYEDVVATPFVHLWHLPT